MVGKSDRNGILQKCQHQCNLWQTLVTLSHMGCGCLDMHTTLCPGPAIQVHAGSGVSCGIFELEVLLGAVPS